jgi:hypothetical protein
MNFLIFYLFFYFFILFYFYMKETFKNKHQKSIPPIGTSHSQAKGNKNNTQAQAQNSNCTKGKYTPKQA